ncbi:DUF2065 family protein [Pseudoroseicyclus sp. H15]
MIATLILSLGLLLVAEGLLWALAPNLIEAMLEVLRAMNVPMRRLVGLGALALGIAIAWLGTSLGA